MVPPSPILNNLLRYQTTIERQLDEALTRLDNLQWRRTEPTPSACEAATAAVGLRSRTGLHLPKLLH